MFKFPGLPYQKSYDEIEESAKRQIELFKNLFSATNEDGRHETFFSPSKLQKSLVLVALTFIEGVAKDKDRPKKSLSFTTETFLTHTLVSNLRVCTKRMLMLLFQ